MRISKALLEGHKWRLFKANLPGEKKKMLKIFIILTSEIILTFRKRVSFKSKI